ncbi:MAG: hypothetical protein ABIF88_01805 [archaeon]
MVGGGQIKSRKKRLTRMIGMQIPIRVLGLEFVGNDGTDREITGVGNIEYREEDSRNPGWYISGTEAQLYLRWVDVLDNRITLDLRRSLRPSIAVYREALAS